MHSHSSMYAMPHPNASGPRINMSPMNMSYHHTMGPSAAAATDFNKAMKNYKPNELFVGNLSYFCEEKDIYELFDQYGNVEDVRIIKNDSGTRSLMFGFVTMSTVHEAREMEKLLNNHLFMGRKIRVAISERRYDFKPPQNEGIQMHVSCCSFFNFNEQLVRPTESFLRKFFVQFGTVLDITMKEYAVYHEQNMQEGYGFVSFEAEDAVLRAISACQNVIVHGVTLKCTITHQHNPHHSKKIGKHGVGNKSNGTGNGSPTAGSVASGNGNASTALAMMHFSSKYSAAPPAVSPSLSHSLPFSLSQAQQSLQPSLSQRDRQRDNERDRESVAVGSANSSWNALRPAATFSSLNPPVPVPGPLSLSSNATTGNNNGNGVLNGSLNGSLSALSSPAFSTMTTNTPTGSCSVTSTPLGSSFPCEFESLDLQDSARGLLMNW